MLLAFPAAACAGLPRVGIVTRLGLTTSPAGRELEGPRTRGGPPARTRSLVVAASRAPLGATPSPPASWGKLDLENFERVQSLTDRGLRARMKRITRVDKLLSLVRVLEYCKRGDLAAEAREALAVRAPDSSSSPSPPPPAAEPGAPPPSRPPLRASAAAAAAQPDAGSPTRPPRRGRAAAAAAAAAAPADADPAAPAPPARPPRRRSAAAAAAAAPAANSAASKGASSKPKRKSVDHRVKLHTVRMKLEDHGMEVFLPDPELEGQPFDWGALAGYEDVKQQVEESVILALSHGKVYDNILKATRVEGAGSQGSNRPRAVLFEGPPGTGKTTVARLIAQRGSVPLVNIKIEAILSQWYGEDEKKLGGILKLCESFPEGAVVFLDELDSFVTSRDSRMHECTRRMLGILLRHLDGFEASKRTIFVGATNRKADLDPALRSRFATCIRFELPGEESRAAILKQYARHLSESDLLALARATPGLAGRDLRAVCEQTERRWAAEIIRGRVDRKQLPSLMGYLSSAQRRLQEARGWED